MKWLLNNITGLLCILKCSMEVIIAFQRNRTNRICGYVHTHTYTVDFNIFYWKELVHYCGSLKNPKFHEKVWQTGKLGGNSSSATMSVCW